jgi:hypothetical protein
VQTFKSAKFVTLICLRPFRALSISVGLAPITTKADGFENGPSTKMQGTPKSLPFGIRMQFQPNTQNS